jgi:hypothetical protein
LIAYRSAPCHSITTPPWLSFFFFFWLWNNLCKSFVQVTFGRCPIDQCWAMLTDWCADVVYGSSQLDAQQNKRNELRLGSDCFELAARL